MKIIYFLLYAATILMPTSENINTSYAALALSPAAASQSTIVEEDEQPELNAGIKEKAAVRTPSPAKSASTQIEKDDFVSAKYNLPRILVIE